MTTQTLCAVTSPLLLETKLLGETYGFWCQTVALIAAAVLAYLALRSSRAIERRKAAAEAIFAGSRDKELTEAVRHIAVLHLGDKNMAVWGKEENKDSEEAKIQRGRGLNAWRAAGNKSHSKPKRLNPLKIRTYGERSSVANTHRDGADSRL
jgi:hypothetical protein